MLITLTPIAFATLCTAAVVPLADSDVGTEVANDDSVPEVQVERVLRRYDANGLGYRIPTDVDEARSRSDRMLVPVLRGEWFDLGFDEFGGETIEGVDLEGLVYELLGEEGDEAGVFITYLGADEIAVSASAAAHARIAQRLAELRHVAASDAQLRVERWRVDRLPDGIVAGLVARETAEGWARALAASGDGGARVVTANAFGDTALPRASGVDLPVALLVEIASGSSSLSTELRRIGTGVGGVVRAAPGNGGWHVALEVGTTDVDPGGVGADVSFYSRVGTDRLTSGGLSARATVRTTSVATDGFVPDGRALVAVEQSSDDAFVTLVWAVGGDSSVVRTIGTTRVLDIGAAARPHVFAERRDEIAEVVPAHALAAAGDERLSNAQVTGVGCGEVESVLEVFASVLFNESEAYAEERSLEIERIEERGGEVDWDREFDGYELVDRTIGASYAWGPLYGQLLVPAEDERGRSTAPLADRLLQRAREVVDAMAPSKSVTTVRGRVFEGDRLLHTFRVPMRVGGRVGVIDVIEQQCVIGLEVEVAENSSAIEPRFVPAISGLCVTLELGDAGDGDTFIEADGSWQRETVDASRFDHPLADGLETLTCAATTFVGRRSLGADPVVFGDASGGGVRLEVEVLR